MKKKHLILIGGGHAHLLPLANLQTFITNNIRVTVVQPSEYHYYSGMGPGMLGGTYLPEDLRFNTKKTVEAQGGHFIYGRAIRIDPVGQQVFLENTPQPLAYDVLSCNTGSQITAPGITIDNRLVLAVKPIEGLLTVQKQIISLSQEMAAEIAIVGGGPSAVEVAGNIWALGRKLAHAPVITLFAGRGILPKDGEKVQKRVQQIFKRRAITIREGCYVKGVAAGFITLERGERCQADLVVSAVGVSPSPLFQDSGITTGPDGGLQVNRYLQSPQYTNIFGGGDCISFQPGSLDKVGVYAVRQNPVLLHNLQAALTGSPLQPFIPQKKYLQIYNLGQSAGVLSKGPLVFGGKTAFWIKNYIDKRFIRRFQ